MERRATVVGGGLAGAEAAWQLARAGISCTLYEMKPGKHSPAHSSSLLAELVCSNSFKAERVESAAGLLKAELRLLGSLCLQCAEQARVPAGGALAVDRALFAAAVTRAIEAAPRITLRREEVTQIPLPGENEAVVVAAGPLASPALSESIQALCGAGLRFYDAAAPIVAAESVDMQSAFAASRYARGGVDDYVNCPLGQSEYEAFHAALVSAERAHTHAFDVYEGCMPIEVLAGRGLDSIRYGPMKPVGLRDPRTGKRPWAVLQLRKENTAGTLLNLVGFQTNLKFGEQQRVFSMIPALRRAEFVRYGVMHRNTFLDSPRLLGADFQMREHPRLYFAGQITGVEGYMESAGAGILAGRNAARALLGESPLRLPPETMLGALSRYVSDVGIRDFQPMGASFGLLPPLPERIRDKKARGAALAERAMLQLTAAAGADS
ncbi:MAG: methylenetetrahydrofolate--tRNA-(uracil(54)-C(5))-methyltransferase (FADH(2)-oxidizing) TrmFO [Oscillospiraceae bacterium]|nr:methylenetetrahydrofolate--tRNA-(uracil(54)-C(5))-methyltransferase (FADH(2)-oxidizing) TrmFO [Oscillospiraceae bacterium]